MADRQEWEHATARSRRLAVSADAELRRRHPGEQIEPLRSAEPASAIDTERGQRRLAPDRKSGETAARVRDLAVERQAFRAKMEERRRLTVPSKALDCDNPGQGFPTWRTFCPDAILQPPKPQIIPSEKILQFARQHDIDPKPPSDQTGSTPLSPAWPLAPSVRREIR